MHETETSRDVAVTIVLDTGNPIYNIKHVYED